MDSRSLIYGCKKKKEKKKKNHLFLSLLNNCYEP